MFLQGKNNPMKKCLSILYLVIFSLLSVKAEAVDKKIVDHLQAISLTVETNSGSRRRSAICQRDH